jgi:hypothetical protein
LQRGSRRLVQLRLTLGGLIGGSEIGPPVCVIPPTLSGRAQSGACGRLARSRGRIRRPAATMIAAPARATKIA